ncbi:MAG TPA: hypothetical protein VMR54_05550, partial [Thermoanaerobaculia bacterium]|nr:hypothetical protein [Thermoanaerobaculia bacterium]
SFDLTVRDTVRGTVKVYHNPVTANHGCLGADTSGFAAATAPTTKAAEVAEVSTLTLMAQTTGHPFEITLQATDPRTGKTGAGQAIPQNDLFGYFTIPTLVPTNPGSPLVPEVFVKMLDARAIPGQDFWFFNGELSDLSFDLTVRDTVRGTVKVYHNPVTANHGCLGADTSGFASGTTPTPTHVTTSGATATRTPSSSATSPTPTRTRTPTPVTTAATPTPNLTPTAGAGAPVITEIDLQQTPLHPGNKIDFYGMNFNTSSIFDLRQGGVVKATLTNPTAIGSNGVEVTVPSNVVTGTYAGCVSRAEGTACGPANIPISNP